MNLLTLMWSIAATVLAGSFIVVALVSPEIGTALSLTSAQLLIAATALGCIVAIPVAFVVTKKMTALK